MTFGVHNDCDLRMLLAEVINVRRLKHLVHAAVPLPENQLGSLNGLHRVAATRHVGIPDDHLLAWDAHFVRRVPAQMLVRKKEDFFTPRPAPFDHFASVRRGTGQPAMFAAEGFEDRGRIHVDRRHDRLLHRHYPTERIPALFHLFNRRHIRHGTTGRHVGKNDRLIGPAQHIGGFRHEVHAAEHHIGPIGTLFSDLGKNQGVATKIGMLNDFIALIIMAENHDLLAERSFGRAGSFEEFFGRQRLIVGNGTGKRGDRFHLQPFG